MTRLLIVRLGALGDIVHALPAAAALRDAYPDARLDWLVDAKHRAVLDLIPILDTRIVLDTRRWSGPRAPLAVIRTLRRANYDAAFDLQGLIKSAALARASGALRVIGYARPQLREPAASACYSEQVDASDTTHVVDKSLALLRAVGIGGGGDGGRPLASPTIRTGHADSSRRERDAASVAHDADAPTGGQVPGRRALRFPLEEPASPVPACTRQLLGLWPDEPFVVINPGAAWPNKRWPAERFGALAREVRARHGLKSAVLWGPGEETLAAQVAASSSGAAEMAPATTVAEVVSLVRAARLVVSGDTGPIHLAAAVGTPVVGLYGPTDPRRNGPWSPADESVSRFERCACHHQRRCRIAAWCLADITLDEVLDAVGRRLARGGQ